MDSLNNATHVESVAHVRGLRAPLLLEGLRAGDVHPLVDPYGFAGRVIPALILLSAEEPLECSGPENVPVSVLAKSADSDGGTRIEFHNTIPFKKLARKAILPSIT